MFDKGRMMWRTFIDVLNADRHKGSKTNGDASNMSNRIDSTLYVLPEWFILKWWSV